MAADVLRAAAPMGEPPNARRIALRYQVDKNEDVSARNVSPEFRLLAACCRWPPSEARDAAVRDAAAALSGWNRFMPLVIRRHRVAGLACAALLSAGIKLPPRQARRLGRRAQRITQRNLLYAAEIVRLQNALAAAGIPVLVLKGIALAQLAYGSLETKQVSDIDLLVPPDRAEAALQILEAEGYALSYPAEHLGAAQRRAVLRYAREVQLVDRGKKVRIELQWRAATNPLLLNGVDAYSATQNVLLPDGNGIRTLATDDLFAYLCVHGAQHAWSRLKWLTDLNALVAGRAGDVARLYRHAQRVGAGLCAAQALVLCQRLFETRLPAALADELRRDGRAARLAAMALRTMTDEYAESDAARGWAGKMRVVLSQFLLGKGWAFFAAQYRSESVRIRDVVDVPLPPRLQFLYPLLRLPLWLWRRARSAVPFGQAR